MNLFNRADTAGLAANAAAPVAATLALNALIFINGWSQHNEAFTSLWYAPPGWFFGVMWTILYVFYGLSRWTAATDSAAAHRRAWWVVALMIWGLAYPWLSGKFDLTMGAYMNVTSLAFTLLVISRLWPVSKKAVYWLLPSVAWECFAVFLGFAALANMQNPPL